MSDPAELAASRASEEVFEPVVLMDKPAPGSWIRAAKCRGMPTRMFFPSSGGNPSRVRQVCNHCPVCEECREYALLNPETKGVWGGLSEHQRSKLRLTRVPWNFGDGPDDQAATSSSSHLGATVPLT